MQSLQRFKAGLSLFAIVSLVLTPIIGPLSAQPAAAADAPICTVSPILVNSCRPWLGGEASAYTAAASDSKSQELYLEQRQGRQNDVIHTYHPVGTNTLSATDVYFATRPNTILYANWKPTATWGNIATQNAAIDSMANSVKALGSTKIMMTLYHEPENEVSPGGDANCPNVTYKGSAGTVADYRNMWAYTEARFAADGVSNVVWVMNYMDYSPWNCLDYDLYPGDNLINWITFDSYGAKVAPGFVGYNDSINNTYNLLTSESNATPDPVTGLTHNFLSKPWGLAEWGVTNTTAQEEQFYDDAKTSLDNNTYPNLKMYMIYDSFPSGGSNRRVGYDDSGTIDPAKGAHYYAFANDPKIGGAWQFADTTAPSVPAGLTATAPDASHVNLSWTASTDNIGVTGYNVYRNGGTTPIATVPSGTTYTDSGLTGLTAYQYTLAAYDAAGNVSAKSTVATVTTPDGIAPSVPTGLVATATNANTVSLSWAPATDNVAVTGYNLYRNGAPIGTVTNGTSYTDAPLLDATNYSYTVSAFDAAGNTSAPSAAAVVSTPDGTAPSAPANLTATATSPTEIDLNWTAATDNVSVTGYQVYRNNSLLTTLANVTSYQDLGVSPQTNYTYTVTALDGAGNVGAPSTAVTATTPALPVDTTPPSVPAGLTATATASGHEIDLSWTASIDDFGVTGYNVYRNGDSTPLTTITGTSFADTGLTDATAYSYTVSAFDAAGNTSAPSTSATATTPDVTAPAAPTGLTANAISASEVDLSWTAASDNVAVTGYQVYRNDLPLATLGNVTAYQDTTAAPQTSYTYTVAALDAAGNASTPSQSADATTPQGPDVIAPSVPTSLTATAVSGAEIDLAWQPATDNTGVAGYNVYRNGSITPIATVTGTTLADTGLANATSYSYTVTAFDAAGNLSAQSATATTTTFDTTAPSAPTNPAALAQTGHAAQITWTPANDNVGVTSYNVYRNGILVGNVATTSFTDTGLTDATAYQYTVSALDAAGNQSAQSSIAAATTPDVTPPTAPTNLVATVNGSQVGLSWAPATDNVAVTGYNVYRNDTLVGTPTGTSFTDAGLTDATTYHYTVTALDAAGNASAQTTVVSATTPDLTAPSVPANVTATAQTGHSIKITWTAAGDNVATTGYAIYRNGAFVTNVPGTSFTDTGLSDATAYQYTVAAFDAAGNTSAQSTAAAATTPDITAPNAPTSVTASALSGTSVRINWIAATDNVGVVSYNVYRGTTFVGSATGTTFTDTGLTNATSYTYTVTALDAAGNQGTPSATASATTPDTAAPSVPAGVTATALSGTSVKVSWNAATDNVAVTGYKLYRGGVLIATIASGTTFTDTGLANATTYSYTVAAFDAAGNTSAVSTAAQVTTPDTLAPTAPTGLSATAASSSQINLAWTAASDNVAVTGYRIYRGTTLVTTITGTSYSDTGLTASTAYSYTVYAIDAAGNQSAVSNTAGATTQAAADTTPPSKPTNFKVTSVTDTTETMTWTAATDNVAVTGYRIYRIGTLVATVTGTSFTDTGLNPKTSYTYHINAIDAASNISAQATAATLLTAADTTAPTMPTGLTLTQNATSIGLAWTAATDDVAVTGYRVYRGGILLATVTTTSYADTTAKQGTSYTYTVAAIDAAGNSGAQTAGKSLLMADTTPPATPAGLTAATGTTAKTVVLKWSADTDNVAVTGYRIYRGTTLVATVSGSTLTYTDTGLTTGTSYSYHIVAIDAAGNASASSTTVSAKAK